MAQIDEKTQALIDKAAERARKDEQKRILGLLGEASTAAGDQEDKVAKKAAKAALNDLKAAIKA